MNNEQINVAIAEVVGWTDVRKGCGDIYAFYGKMPDGSCRTKVPDYCNDLNAMHEAQQTLSEDQRGLMIDALYLIIEKEPNKIHRDFDATAHQRAEAFLRTLGKWVD